MQDGDDGTDNGGVTPGGGASGDEADDLDHPDENMEEDLDRGKGGGGGGKGRPRPDPKASKERGRAAKVLGAIGKHKHRASSRG